MRFAPIALALLLPACTYWSGDASVVVTSTPPGAEVLLDGEPTGSTTPVALDLGGVVGTDHVITLRKPGYDGEERTVFHYTTAYSARWNDGAADIGLWPLPLFWTFGDVVLPFGVKWRYVPHELHVKLYQEGTSPVHGQ